MSARLKRGRIALATCERHVSAGSESTQAVYRLLRRRVTSAKVVFRDLVTGAMKTELRRHHEYIETVVGLGEQLHEENLFF